MRVRRLEINGFKSFADKTVVDFPLGMCAVVGPNGCGKSNVVDSIRWVLGEQSPKQLRGHSREDVIFNGSTGRRPLGVAEVSLVFENTGDITHQSFADLAEIMVTRRLYRSGESEYLINKIPCRLKDIQQLLMDTGLGNRSYAIIEQGRVAAFIEAKPEERRLWVEEAAGITRYKNQKKLSLRKMQSAQDNLNRLMDIMVEVETQMKRLDRQAKKAQKYNELRKEIRGLDLNIASSEYLRLQDELSQSNAERDALGAGLLLANQRVTAQETDLETLKVRLVAAEQDISEAGQKRLRAEGDIQKAENELTLLSREMENQRRMRMRYSEESEELKLRLRTQEKDLAKARRIGEEAEERLSRAREKASQAATEASDFKEKLKVMENRVDLCKQALVDHLSQTTQAKNRLLDLERNQSDLLRRKESLQTRKDELAAELKDLRSRFEETRQERDGLAVEMEGLDSQAAGLEEERLLWQGRVKQAGNQEQQATRAMHEHKAAVDALTLAMQSRDWVQNGVRRVLEEASKQKTPVEILGITADHLQVEPGRESLVETALGDDLQAILVKSGQDFKNLSAWAEESKLGRLRILALDDLGQTRVGPPSGMEPITAYVRPNQGFEPLANLFQDAACCANLDQAWDTAAALAPGQFLVTDQGHRLDRPGAALLGVGQREDGVLARQNQLAERKEKLEKARADLERASQERSEAEERLGLQEEEFSRIRSQKQETERSLARLEQDLFRVKETGSLKKRELEGVEYHAEELNADYERVAEEYSTIQEKLADHQGRHSELEEDLARAREDLEYGKEELEQTRAEENQARLEEAAVASETEYAQSEAARLEQDTQKARARSESLELEVDKADQAIVRFSERKEAEQLRLGGLYQDLDEQKEAHQKAKELHSQAQMQLSDLEQDLKQARQEQRRAESACQELDLKYKELLLSRENLCEKIMERCRVDLSTNHQNHLPEKPFDPETARMRLAKLRQQLSNLGAVNLEAISEHQALSERYNFLTSQKEDLEESLADLRQAIRKINKTSRQRFNATLEQVNQRLAEIYPVLFSGGQAQLITDPDADPLEAGLHLLVELPGKKVKNLEALSGGEKALSAVAVLFALFLIRPAPFCILDEVDAPLDEANVNRFHDLVQKLSHRSQIIMITHSRRTMEIMDQLYGVTMEEKGVSKILSVNLAQGESMAA